MNLITHRLPSTARAAAPGLWRACKSLFALLLLAWLALLPTTARAAELQAVLTLLEGDAAVVVGARAYTAAVGARLDAGALLETDAKTSLLRLEWPDGTVLDLGPATRVMLRPPALAAGKSPLFYLLQGWAKQSQASAAPGQLSSAFDVRVFKGALVSQVDGNTAVCFAETGDTQLVARRSGQPLTLQPGQAAVLGIDGFAQAQSRPPAGWLQRIPPAFRDTLPPRAAQFTGPPTALNAQAALSYQVLQPWLTAEAAVRRNFPARFAELLRDREFHAAVTRHLAQHPEWEPVVRPLSKSKPKPKPIPNNVATDPEPPR